MFFGRDAETQELMETVQATRADPTKPRLIVMLGASGAGKSSLLKAGLLARLRRRQGEWLVLKAFTPGRDSIGSLAFALIEASQEAGSPLSAQRSQQLLIPDQREQAVREVCAELRATAVGGGEAEQPRTIVLPIDQFEEAL